MVIIQITGERAFLLAFHPNKVRYHSHSSTSSFTMSPNAPTTTAVPATKADLVAHLRALKQYSQVRQQQIHRLQSQQHQRRSYFTGPRRLNWARTQQNLSDVIHSLTFCVELCAAHVEKVLGLSPHVRRVWYINAVPTIPLNTGDSPTVDIIVADKNEYRYYWASVCSTPNSKYIVSASAGAATLHSIRYYCDVKKERRTALSASLDFANNYFVGYNRFKFAVRVLWNKNRIGPCCSDCIKTFVWRTYRRGYIEYIGKKLDDVTAPPISLNNEATVDAWNDFFRHL